MAGALRLSRYLQGEARDDGICLMWEVAGKLSLPHASCQGRPTLLTRTQEATPKRAAHLSSRLARPTDGLVGASASKGQGCWSALQADLQPYSSAYRWLAGCGITKLACHLPSAPPSPVTHTSLLLLLLLPLVSCSALSLSHPRLASIGNIQTVP